jgi:EAL domain-containing protein (putative c-di-GMP-specific phosphodiesterase class I)
MKEPQSDGILRDEASGLSLYVAHIDNVVRGLQKSGALGILAVRLLDSLRVEASLGSRAFERTLQRAAQTLDQHLETLLNPPWHLGVNGYGGDLLVVFFTQTRDGKAVSEESLFQVKEAIQALRADRFAFTAGCAFVRTRPSVDLRRLIYQGVEHAMVLAVGEDMTDIERQGHVLRRIIYQSYIRTVFQPIVSLDGSEGDLGHEALTRGPAETEFESPDFLFALSRRSGLLQELDFLCRNVAVSSARTLEGRGKIFINTLAHTLAHRRFLSSQFFDLLKQAHIEPARIVFEVSEKHPIADYSEFRRNAAELREHGFSLAVDDAGMGYSNLRTLFELEPDYVKIDHSLVHDIHREPVHEQVFDILADISKQLDARVIAEGVETKEELEKLQSMGVPYGQGFYFAKPAALHTAQG